MYEESLILKDVNYYYEKKKEEFPTGVCIVLITPDKEIVENNGLNENIRLLLQLFSKDEALKYLDAG